ncbi:type I-F CRISPR-associated helicase Cas3 [Paramixta manurensis]|uniref:Type I-F CRISPR-associated helicase Cas3 n=1 Tax=Paramixta manurensis TaxID=2740817 RepID=A0A6M8UBP7_9GAMM|nr:type I-F CRISPR-associated helicase Cas3 [Erwiniaceae bacterium PD-1]
MNVLIISQCSKRARIETCRILDQFAERTGDSVWQTTITLEGLTTLRKLLRKSARRNSAIACHWLKKNGQSELMWVVGNLRRFNTQGRVPTNRTTGDILRQRSEHHWHSAESIALLAAIAGLFHDFGKAGALFQKSLTGKAVKRYQPFRHEWISVRLFQAWVGTQTDAQWLTQLGRLEARDEAAMLARLRQDNQNWTDSPFAGLPPLAQVVAWLILSHHRLPQFLGKNEPPLSGAQSWLTNQLNVDWNALNYKDGWNDKDFQRAWTFPGGTPLQSNTWREKARQLAKRAANAPSLHEFGKLEQGFTVHLARLALMLADHFYSAQAPHLAWQDTDYAAWANTDRSTKQLKQKLDEHNVAVAHHALLLGRTLPILREHLPAIARHKGFRQRATDKPFQWQNKAWDVAAGLRERSYRQGFFGINMASTGCGKTLANARIMYALAGEEQGCRFTVALGLRTLTLQTGDALRTRLGLDEDDLAVLIGSSAVRELHARNNEETDEGSASADELFAEHQYVHYDGVINQGPLRHVLDSDPKLSKLINAPVLVATIDHLMPATEGTRGGKQIAPMLRLLTSDLVLDEPDDFDISDQHALCRLVNWAGMLGSRVLLSSATLPPSQVLALYSAYLSGRRAYQQACGEPGTPLEVCCAWFDEFDEEKSCEGLFGQPTEFYRAHCEFAGRRAKRLPLQPTLRQAKLINVVPVSTRSDEVIHALATKLRAEILNLHALHRQQCYGDKTVSLGLVRMANINPLVATAQVLMGLPSPENYCIHYCVYHSQYPLAVRSHIEQHLDGVFTRNRERPAELPPKIAQAVRQHPAQHHIFVVLGTSVVEVGRDWDADWGIAEPSSMRALIQFAGRIQRHRQVVPQSNNLLILNKNVRALRGDKNKPVYCRPGFETTDFMLTSHDLTDLLAPEHYRFINAVPRILDGRPKPPVSGQYDSFIALEHARLWEELLGKGDKYPVAAHWWRLPVNWSGELQRRKPFRRSQPESQFFLRMEDEFDTPIFMARDEGAAGWKDPGIFKYHQVTLAAGVAAWVDTDYATVLLALAESLDMELAAVCERFGEITLRTGDKDDHQAWLWHPLLGVFRDL